jgi:hypothetical protein
LISPSALLRSPAVIRFRVFLGTALALSAIVVTLVNAQLTDEEKKKRDARTKAREEMRAIASPAPAETPEPTAKPKPAKRKAKSKKLPKAKPTPTPRPKKSPTPEPEESPALKSKTKSGTKKTGEEDEEQAPTPKQKKKTESKETPEPAKKPGVKKNPTPEPDESPTPKPGGKKKTEATETPPKRIEKAEPVKTPTPPEKQIKPAPEPARTPPPEPPTRTHPGLTAPLPQAALPSDITVEKSGLEKEQGLEPPPSPPPKRGFWPFSRQPANYRYLTNATIDAIRRAPVQRARWKFVIVHNSGTRQGNARAFDYYHRKIRRMRNGLAYHFVIGNGTSSRNGQIEIGDRWRRQINGGHVHSDYMNNIGLGICLVGDFNRDQPTRAQLEACEELIRYLRERCGQSDGHSLIVRPHREVNPPRWSTDCPGDAFPYGWFGRFR